MNRQRDEEDFWTNLRGIFYHVLGECSDLPVFCDDVFLSHLQQHTQVLKNLSNGKYFVKIFLETVPEHNFQVLLHFFSTVFYSSEIDGIRLFTRQEFDPFLKIQFFELSLQGVIAFMVNHF